MDLATLLESIKDSFDNEDLLVEAFETGAAHSQKKFEIAVMVQVDCKEVP